MPTLPWLLAQMLIICLKGMHAATSDRAAMRVRATWTGVAFRKLERRETTMSSQVKPIRAKSSGVKSEAGVTTRRAAVKALTVLSAPVYAQKILRSMYVRFAKSLTVEGTSLRPVFACVLPSTKHRIKS